MGRNYARAGFVGYEGIKFLHNENVSPPSEPKDRTLAEVIKDYMDSGLNEHKIAKKLGMTVEEINKFYKVDKEEVEMSRVKMDKAYFEKKAEIMGVNLKERLFSFEDLEEMARKEDIPTKVIGTQASRQGFYVKQSKKDKAKISAEKPIEPDVKESMDACDKRLEEKAEEKDIKKQDQKEKSKFPPLVISVELEGVEEAKKQLRELAEIGPKLRYELWIDKDGNTTSETYEGDVADIIILLERQGRIAS